MHIFKLVCLTFATVFVLIIMTPRCSANTNGNWTFEDLLKYRKNSTLSKMASLNCTTFYDIEETTKYINECTIAIVGNGSEPLENHHATRRDVSYTYLDLDEIDIINILKRVKRQAIGEKQFLPSGLRIRVNNPWRIMESKAILDEPCIGQCMLQKMSILNEVEMPERDEIILRVLQVLEIANGTQKDATAIADKCIQRFERRIDKISQSTESKSIKRMEKCRAGSRLGVCLSKDAYNNCREAFIGSVTSTKHRQGQSKSSNKN